MSKQSLDDTLREILADYAAGFSDNVMTDTITEEMALAQIKQAFADEGYVPMHQLNIPEGTTKVTITYEGVRGTEHSKEFLGGQEWYDRFFKELQAGNSANIVAYANLGILEAAKRTAGLQEPK